MMASAVAFGNVKALRAKLEQALARLGPRSRASPTTSSTSSPGFTAGSIASTAARTSPACSSERAACSACPARSASASPRISRAEGRAAAGALLVCPRHPRSGRARPEARRQAPGSGPHSRRSRRLERLQAAVALSALDGPPRRWRRSRTLGHPDRCAPRSGRHAHPQARAKPRLHQAQEPFVEDRAKRSPRALRRFDREDPAKYDFALCHMGMLQRCPSRRDPVRCEGCGYAGVPPLDRAAPGTTGARRTSKREHGSAMQQPEAVRP